LINKIKNGEKYKKLGPLVKKEYGLVGAPQSQLLGASLDLNPALLVNEGGEGGRNRRKQSCGLCKK